MRGARSPDEPRSAGVSRGQRRALCRGLVLLGGLGFLLACASPVSAPERTADPTPASSALEALVGDGMANGESQPSAATGDAVGQVPGTATSERFVTSTSAAPSQVWPGAAALGPRQVFDSNVDGPEFESGPAPSWPFVGVVQLRDSGDRWWLLYMDLQNLDGPHAAVSLPGFRANCLGRLGIVSHGSDGIEVGGLPGNSDGAMFVRWGMHAAASGDPTQLLVGELEQRTSDLAVSTRGDFVVVESAESTARYEMRHPARGEGSWWEAQVRHRGDLLVLSVQPSHIPCLNGITWISHAPTGHVLACGADAPSTQVVVPEGTPTSSRVLPTPEALGGVLDCSALLDLSYLALQYSRIRSSP